MKYSFFNTTEIQRQLPVDLCLRKKVLYKYISQSAIFKEAWKVGMWYLKVTNNNKVYQISKKKKIGENYGADKLFQRKT